MMLRNERPGVGAGWRVAGSETKALHCFAARGLSRRFALLILAALWRKRHLRVSPARGPETGQAARCYARQEAPAAPRSCDGPCLKAFGKITGNRLRVGRTSSPEPPSPRPIVMAPWLPSLNPRARYHRPRGSLSYRISGAGPRLSHTSCKAS